MRLPTPEFKVLLYGPGLPPAGIKARAHFEDAVLVVQGKGHWFTIQGDRLNLQTGGFDGRQWLLSWLTPSGQVTAMLQGDDAVEAFIKLAPDPISGQLKRLHRFHGNTPPLLRIGVMFVMGLALLATLSIGACWIFAEQLSYWAATRMPQAQRNQLGDMAYTQLIPTLQWVERGVVRETVEFVGVRVLTGARNRYILHVAESPQVNSTALPGGRIIVYTGALRKVQNANELAAMLAQTASHAETHRTLSNLIHALGLRAVIAAAVGDLSSGIWQDMAATLIQMQFSQAQEREADQEALAMLQRAGVSSDGLLPYLERMAAQDMDELEAARSDIQALPAASKDRLEALRQDIAILPAYPNHPLAIDWPLFERALSQ